MNIVGKTFTCDKQSYKKWRTLSDHYQDQNIRGKVWHPKIIEALAKNKEILEFTGNTECYHSVGLFLTKEMYEEFIASYLFIRRNNFDGLTKNTVISWAVSTVYAEIFGDKEPKVIEDRNVVEKVGTMKKTASNRICRRDGDISIGLSIGPDIYKKLESLYSDYIKGRGKHLYGTKKQLYMQALYAGIEMIKKDGVHLALAHGGNINISFDIDKKFANKIEELLKEYNETHFIGLDKSLLFMIGVQELYKQYGKPWWRFWR